jgi:hypothetical protein
MSDCLKFPWSIWSYFREKSAILIENYYIIKTSALNLTTTTTAEPLTLRVIKPKFGSLVAIFAYGLN